MKQYQCNLCGKIFDDRSNYYRHKKNKNPCIPDGNVETFASLKLQNKELQDTVSELKKQLATTSIPVNNTKVKNNGADCKIKINNAPKTEIHNAPKTVNLNNCVLNNINNVTNQPLTFIQLLPYDKERYDHVRENDMLQILSNDSFTKSLTDLADAVYFSSKAPENMRWCVTDKHSALGATEYNHQDNKLHKANAKDVIVKNLRCLIDGMSDKFEDLRELCTFTAQQDKIYHRFFTLIGNEDGFTTEHINAVKDVAYDSRNFVQGHWEKLRLQHDIKSFQKNAPRRTAPKINVTAKVPPKIV